MDLERLLELIARGEGENVEFKEKITREIAKDVCAMANTNGGYIIIGVSDDKRIVGVKEGAEEIYKIISEIKPPVSLKIFEKVIEEKRVVVIEVRRNYKLHSLGGRVYFRIGSHSRPLDILEITQLSTEYLLVPFDTLPSSARVKDIVEEYLEYYLKRREEIRGTKIRCSKLEILKKIKAIKGDRLTNAGVLFFTEDPSEFIEGAFLRLVWFEGREPGRYKDDLYLTGPVWKILDEVEKYFRKNLRRIGGEKVGWKRIQLLEYPILALREAVTNALIHKNYTIPSPVTIWIFEDRIEIRNPGSVPPTVDLSNPSHVPRNPLLCEYMYDVGYIERFGYGIRMMFEETRKHPFVDLEIIRRPYSTVVVFRKKEERIFDEKELKIIEVLEKEGPISSSEISKKIGLSKPATLEKIKKLMKMGIVEAIGRGPQRRYRLSKS